MTDYYVYMMVLELVAIAHAVLTDPQPAADCASPQTLIFAGIVINFVLSATTCSGLVHALQHVPCEQLPETLLPASFTSH
jgi:hypothetical protein